MRIKLLYFGRPREILNISDENIDLPEHIGTLEELLFWLQNRGGNWKTELAENRICYAINQEMTTRSASLHEYDEIALFSPVSGG